jgi:hypothetical protein|tara:strand:+ start:565 stop:732 length:168 start_codon:yes stop_codon:yes gene_type:complete
MINRQIAVKQLIAIRLKNIDTSEVPKKAQRNPDIKYTIGLNNVTFCQNGGKSVIE